MCSGSGEKRNEVMSSFRSRVMMSARTWVVVLVGCGSGGMRETRRFASWRVGELRAGRMMGGIFW